MDFYDDDDDEVNEQHSIQCIHFSNSPVLWSGFSTDEPKANITIWLFYLFLNRISR